MDEREFLERLRRADEAAARYIDASRRLRRRQGFPQQRQQVERTARPLLDRLTDAGYGRWAR
jgi:hypothetical protein